MIRRHTEGDGVAVGHTGHVPGDRGGQSHAPVLGKPQNGGGRDDFAHARPVTEIPKWRPRTRRAGATTRLPHGNRHAGGTGLVPRHLDCARERIRLNHAPDRFGMLGSDP